MVITYPSFPVHSSRRRRRQRHLLMVVIVLLAVWRVAQFQPTAAQNGWNSVMRPSVGVRIPDGQIQRTTSPASARLPFQLTTYLKASNADANDYFGGAVAMDEDTLVIGALGESSAGALPTDNSAESAGAVYVFVRTNGIWTQQAYLKALNADAGDRFGGSVALMGDTLVVGAPNEDGSGVSPADNNRENAGAAYIFVRSGTTWTQQAYLKAANPGAYDDFGQAVAIAGDTLVVGAAHEDSDGSSPADNSREDTGAAYVFVRTGTTWTQQAYLKAAMTDNQDYFGWSVALSGDTVVIGAQGEDSAGSSPADNSAENAGAAYVFVRSVTDGVPLWTQQGYLKALNAEAEDEFGVAVAMSNETIIIGAWLEDSNGSSPSDNSADRSGAAYVFVPSNDGWTQQAYLKAATAQPYDWFGKAVAIDGDTVVIGADGDNTPDNPPIQNGGAGYVFVRTSSDAGSTWTLHDTVTAMNAEDGDYFGGAVAVAGNTVVVSALFEDSNGSTPSDNSAENAGAVYVLQPGVISYLPLIVRP